MRIRWVLSGAMLALLLSGMPAAAQSQTTGYARSATGLLAGPGVIFPELARVDADAQLEILGCVEGYSWCDVTWNGSRGWIDARQLESVFHGRRVSVSRYGLQADVPTLEFEQRSYWESNYRNRPFFADQKYWSFFP